MLVAERRDPVASFVELTRQSPWDDFQVAYFAGEANWNYFVSPFLFARPVRHTHRKTKGGCPVCKRRVPSMARIGSMRLRAGQGEITDMSAAGSPLMDGIRESLDRYAKPEAAAAVQLRRGKLGARAEVLGAVTLVLGDTSRWSFIGLRTAAGPSVSSATA